MVPPGVSLVIPFLFQLPVELTVLTDIDFIHTQHFIAGFAPAYTMLPASRGSEHLSYGLKLVHGVVSCVVRGY
jgi:hypothetical protein